MRLKRRITRWRDCGYNVPSKMRGAILARLARVKIKNTPLARGVVIVL